MKDFTIICSLILLFTSCGDNINIEPQQAISTNVALSDEQGIKTAIIGTYDMLSWLPATSSGDVIVNSELFADTENLIWTDFPIPLTQVLNKNIAPTNTVVEHFWIYSYRTINQTNTILNKIEDIEEIDTEVLGAEVRFIRGLVYFDLISMFSLPWTAGDPESMVGVPIVSTPAEESLDNPEVLRNSVAEVYDFILDDLIFAKEHLPEQNEEFANTYAASVL
ncbi:MAG: hypothetical protein HKN68_02505, partial [Saprospiraceae bacterium]|nr:hypothetical protein [Saprospiraceae bacterium]